jgi:hypothetical protein
MHEPEDHFVIPHAPPPPFCSTATPKLLPSFTMSFIFLGPPRTTKPYLSLNCERACVLKNLSFTLFLLKKKQRVNLHFF